MFDIRKALIFKIEIFVSVTEGVTIEKGEIDPLIKEPPVEVPLVPLVV